MQGDRIVGVGLCGLTKFLGHLTFRVSQDYARLTLSLRLGLHRHCIFERSGNKHILDLYRNNIDAPWFGACVDDLL